MNFAGYSRLVAAALVLVPVAVRLPAQSSAYYHFQRRDQGMSSFHRGVNFDDHPEIGPTTPVTTQWDLSGVSFSPGLFITEGPSSHTGISGRWLSNVNPTPFGPGIIDSFSMYLGVADHAAFAWYSAPSTPVTFTIQAFYNNIAESGLWSWSSGDASVSPYIHVWADFNHGFDEIRVSLDRPAALWFDNVQYTIAVVPEPTSLALMATGLAVMLGMGWRRRSGRRTNAL